jgi:hypothetical protein
MISRNWIYLLGLALLGSMLVFSGCEEEEDFNEGPFISKRRKILRFDFQQLEPPVVGQINTKDSTVLLRVPFGTDLTNLVPTIEVSPKATVAPPSGVANDFSTPATYWVTAENGTVQDWVITIEVGEPDARKVLKLSDPVWNRSPSGTGIPDFFTADGERGLAYGNGHLYITNNNDKVLILSPNDGSQLGQLDMTGVDGGGPKISDVAVSEDGQILACNTVEWTSDAGGEPTEFKIYKWADENSPPEVFLSYTNTEYRIGDSFAVIGDVSNDAVILTCFGRKFLNPATRGDLVFLWRVTGGLLNPVPEIIQVDGVPTLSKFGSRPHAQMLNVDSGELYVNGNDIDFTLANLQGEFITRIPNSGRDLYDGFTSYFDLFEFSEKQVLIGCFPRSNTESRLLVIDITGGLENVEMDDVILSDDLMENTGEIANVNASGAVAYHQVDENTIEVYCLITNQALAKFTLITEIE